MISTPPADAHLLSTPNGASEHTAKKETLMTKTERKFGMHPHLLFDIILRQAGTLQKALLEGVMNSIDAGATECRITFDTHSFSIEDNGRGFQSHKEIEDFFETFGTPHEEGDAVFGKFRMGRGQLFAFGRNRWRTRQFEMEVDIKEKGLDYNLIEKDEIFDGTRIEAELYTPVMPSELERNKSELRKFVAWAQIPVYLNGDLISKHASEGKWTSEDDDAYYALSPDRTQLAVYNLGVLVNEFWSGRFGVGGTIVTKSQIEVNFARNDIQASTCPVFKRIQAKIKTESGQAAKKKTKLSAGERDMLVKDFLAGEIDAEDGLKLKALTDVNGRSWQINKLAQIKSKYGGQLIVASRGDQMIETAQRRGIAFSIDEGTLERFGASDGKAFLSRVAVACSNLKDRLGENSYCRESYQLQNLIDEAQTIKIIDQSYLSQFVDSKHIALEAKELSKDQTILLKALKVANDELVWRLNQASYEDRSFDRRLIHLGKSETAEAWTDGMKNIWVRDEHARLLRRGYAGAYQITMTLLHELLHSGPDTGTHDHDHHFYQSFHDLSGHPIDPVGLAAQKMVKTFATALSRNKKVVSQKLLAADDIDLMIEETRSVAETVE
jgi:hypothetical protein